MQAFVEYEDDNSAISIVTNLNANPIQVTLSIMPMIEIFTFSLLKVYKNLSESLNSHLFS